eukprot:m.56824 g.56824  ORF g.56824 m.56824 type:complete len:99 (+) comp34655_c0_seq1:252-548(+)
MKRVRVSQWIGGTFLDSKEVSSLSFHVAPKAMYSHAVVKETKEKERNETMPDKVKLLEAIHEWKLSSSRPTVGSLLAACVKGGLAKPAIERQYLADGI